MPGHTQKASWDISPKQSQPGNRRRWIVSTTIRQLYSWERPFSHLQEAGWTSVHKISRPRGFDPRKFQPLAYSLYRPPYLAPHGAGFLNLYYSNAFMTVQCTEARRMARIKSTYTVRRSALWNSDVRNITIIRPSKGWVITVCTTAAKSIT